MTTAQKAGRVIALTSTVVVGSIIVAMLGALGLYLVQKGREIGSTPELLKGLGIIFVGVIVNVVCAFILLQIKRADAKLVPPKK